MNTTPSLIKSSTFAALPPVWPEVLLPRVRAAVEAAERTLVVLDDDPTGTQTVHDVPVLTRWDLATLLAELDRALPCFFILTNSRSLTAEAARALNVELARNLQQASALTGRAFTLVTRSDSTLRGHFPVETDALAEVCGPFDATILAPYFEAGGRYTLNDVHYVAEGDALVPAADTPFARDAAFGYRSSNLREWVEEKTGGRILGADVQTLPLDLLRRGGPEATAAALLALPRDSVCVANLCAPGDAEVLAAATLAAECAGRKYLYRTAASFVSARLGLAPRPLLAAEDLKAGEGGGLTIVGSYVPKTSEQLRQLLDAGVADAVEISVEALLADATRADEIARVAMEMNLRLLNQHDVVVFTSRALVTGKDAGASLAIGGRISEALVQLVRNLGVRPRYLIAKGGITSSDLATRGLGVKRAMVLGQILPGVPVWEPDASARFPGMPCIVFPGNVGDADALKNLVAKLGFKKAAGQPATTSSR